MLSLVAGAAAQPVNWQLGLQDSAADRMTRIIDLHNFVLVIITIICLFVLGLLTWIMIRYNAKANPKPSATTHNTVLEVLWTVVPVAILVTIAIPSFRLLYYEDVIPPADMTIKAIGNSGSGATNTPTTAISPLMLWCFQTGSPGNRWSRGFWARTTTWWCRSTKRSA